MKYFFIFLMRLYQYTIGAMIPTSCRFAPSCSEYSIEAFKKHGIRKGCLLTLKRLAKCHPWHPGGGDPVP
ncbi:MAG: membrane protein insertion efficiency factor YidD [Simkania negevensis]|nr:membrane protein insertion efficiency factor YidD [Simkania negevensis]